MFKRRFALPAAAFAAATGLLVVGAGAASAAPTTAYPPVPHCGLSVSSSGVEPGQIITVSGGGSGLTANHIYTVSVYSSPVQIGSTTTNASGLFSVDVKVPALADGTHEIKLDGAVCDTATITVGETQTESAAGLAFTGTPVVAAGIAGIGLLAIGGIVLAAGRRRNSV
jgi:hypothetical protein